MNSGVSHHARGNVTAKALAKVGAKRLAATRSWTAFALAKDRTAEELAVALKTHIVTVWTSDDHGVDVRFGGPDGWSAELSLSFDDDAPPSRADTALLATLVKRGVITAVQRDALRAQLRLGATKRQAWIVARGFESVLRLPDPLPRPPPAASSTPRAAITSPPAPSGVVDPAVLAAHIHYWTEVFQLNCFWLANRYKKHLPAERRAEVETLLGYCAMGAEPGELEAAVTSILAAVWTADDWVAAIRTPQLAQHEPLDDEQRATWVRILASLPA